MNNIITIEVISPFRKKLEEHPIYKELETIGDLRCFMEHHIYSVWDFMSLVKYLQSVIAPSGYPWVDNGASDIKRFINELVLGEESDEDLKGGSFISHFELYQEAMKEVGADVKPSITFTQLVYEKGIDKALLYKDIPTPSKEFTLSTFACLKKDKAHMVAASLALGREHIIPTMFRSILSKIGISKEHAPKFYYYLKRHIDLDDNVHGPLSLKLLNYLCEGDEIKVKEAIDTAKLAIENRIQFWDAVLDKIKARKLRRERSKQSS